MNRTEFLRFDRTALVYRFSQQVEDASQSFFSNRDRDRSAGVDAFHTALETVGCTEGNAANATAAKVGEVYGPVAGIMGSYVVRVANKETGTFYSEADAKNLALQKAQYLSQMILSVMSDYDNVKDNRERFF